MSPLLYPVAYDAATANLDVTSVLGVLDVMECLKHSSSIAAATYGNIMLKGP